MYIEQVHHVKYTRPLYVYTIIWYKASDISVSWTFKILPKSRVLCFNFHFLFHILTFINSKVTCYTYVSAQSWLEDLVAQNSSYAIRNLKDDPTKTISRYFHYVSYDPRHIPESVVHWGVPFNNKNTLYLQFYWIRNRIKVLIRISNYQIDELALRLTVGSKLWNGIGFYISSKQEFCIWFQHNGKWNQSFQISLRKINVLS